MTNLTSKQLLKQTKLAAKELARQEKLAARQTKLAAKELARQEKLAAKQEKLAAKQDKLSIATLLYKAKERKDLVSFLAIDELISLRDLGFDCANLSFNECVSLCLTSLRALEILIDSNNTLRTERYRYNNATHELYEFSFRHGAYLFCGNVSVSKYNLLKSHNGMYVD